MKLSKLQVLLTTLLLTLVISGCSNKKDTLESLNLGYFPNVSHAPAMVGVEKGYLQDAIGDVTLATQNFPNGSLFMDALSTGQIDLGYVGPGPAINRFLQGGDFVIISGVAQGENVMIVRKDVAYENVADLVGKVVATPSTGCTHDLLLREMLQREDLAVEENGGTVKRLPQKPATMIGLFEQKQIDAAVVSEPWASIMEAQGIVNIVKDATELPWEGSLPASVLVVRKDFLEKHPDIVEAVLKSNEESIDFINNNREEAVTIIATQIEAITEQAMDLAIIDKSLNNIFFSTDVDIQTLQEFADLSKTLGFVEGSSDLTGFVQ